MSHEVETMAWAHEVPWHGLGVRVDASITPEEMAVQAGIDWTVSKRPLAVVTAPAEDDPDGDFEYDAVEGHNALVRDTDGKVFDIVSDRWEPVQNADVMRFFRDFCASGAATMETAGALKGGEIVWGLANLGHGFTLPGGDAVRGYVALLSRHRSGYATIARVTPTRIVCANTLAMSGGFGKAGAAEARYNHLSEFSPERAAQEIGLAHDAMTQFEANAKSLLALNLSRDDMARMLAPIYQPGLLVDEEPVGDDAEAVSKALVPDWVSKANRTVAGIMDAALKSPGGDVVGHSAWGLLNGATYYANHEARGTRDSRFTSALIGDSNVKVNRLASGLLTLTA